jgi:hypothetical protein
MRVTIGGLELEIVTPEQAARAAVCVCALWDGPVYFTDDVKAACGGCGVAVRHRPYIPARPTKLCMACAMRWAKPH